MAYLDRPSIELGYLQIRVVDFLTNIGDILNYLIVRMMLTLYW